MSSNRGRLIGRCISPAMIILGLGSMTHKIQAVTIEVLDYSISADAVAFFQTSPTTKWYSQIWSPPYMSFAVEDGEVGGKVSGARSSLYCNNGWSFRLDLQVDQGDLGTASAAAQALIRVSAPRAVFSAYFYTYNLRNVSVEYYDKPYEEWANEYYQWMDSDRSTPPPENNFLGNEYITIPGANDSIQVTLSNPLGIQNTLGNGSLARVIPGNTIYNVAASAVAALAQLPENEILSPQHQTVPAGARGISYQYLLCGSPNSWHKRG
jgi:hypothetical protein